MAVNLTDVDETSTRCDNAKKNISYWWIFGYSASKDRVMQSIGAIACLAAGTTLPLMTVVLGSLTTTFTDVTSDHANAAFQHKVNQRALDFVYLGIGIAVATYVYTYCWIVSGENTARRIQDAYLRATLSRPIADFDAETPGAAEARLLSDVKCIQEGISEKVGIILSSVSTFVTAMIIAFTQDWRLALVVCAILPAMVLLTGITAALIGRHAKDRLRVEAEAKGLVAHILSVPTVVQSLSNVDALAEMYERKLRALRPPNRRTLVWTAAMLSMIPIVLYSAYALAFWQGHKELLAKRLDTGSVVTVLFAVILAAFALGQGARHLQIVTMAMVAAQRIFDQMEQQGLKPGGHSSNKQHVSVSSHHSIADSVLASEHEKGTIQFRNVCFSYPSRPDTSVLQDFSLDIPAHATTAIVGPTGSGKSSILSLLAGFYVPDAGEILVDGNFALEYDISRLRSQIGQVMQGSQVFSATVFENVAFGLMGTEMENEGISSKYERVFAACEQANVTKFVKSLPNGFETRLGQGGVSLSGGQQQRIAIARAIVRQPRFLFLDEATASLDSASERVVSEALRKASESRTVIVIAHRLNTICHADAIVVVERGRVVEQGTHDDLMRRGAHYRALVKAQSASDGASDVSRHQSRKSLRRKSTKKSKRWSGYLATLWLDSATDLTTYELCESNHSPEDTEPQRHSGSISTLGWLFSRSSRLEFSKYLVPGVFASIACGSVFLFQALVFAHLIVLFAAPWTSDFGGSVHHYCLLFVDIALGALATKYLSVFLLGSVSDNVIERLRLKTFQVLLRKDLDWVANSGKSTSELVDLAFDTCGRVAGAHGNALSVFVSVGSNLVSISILSVVLDWRLLAIVGIAIPALLASGYVRAKVLGQFQVNMQKEQTHATSIATEALGGIRTIRSFQMEEYFLDKYGDALALISRKASISVLSTAALFAFSQSLSYLVNAFTIWYGALLIRKGFIDVYDFFACFVAITFGSQEAGESFLYAPDSAGALKAAGGIKALHEEDAISRASSSIHGPSDILSPSLSDFNINFHNVHFAYPITPERPVHRGLTMTIKPGQHIAIVGPSGSGKSSTISLLSRFFTPSSGHIIVGSTNLFTDLHSSVALEAYRQHIGYVTQESVLFPDTISKNILLGLPKRDVDVMASQEKELLLEEVCTVSCIHSFVASLPEGYNTHIGSGSGLLSGGQKQRITIARALLRKPKLLLMDEATSALDGETEREVVRRVGEFVRGWGGTVVSVSHRWGVVKEADLCFVLEGGSVVQRGSWRELMREGGLFGKLFGGEGREG